MFLLTKSFHGSQKGSLKWVIPKWYCCKFTTVYKLRYIRVQLIECGVEVELVGVESGFLRQHRVHVLVRDDGHALDVLDRENIRLFHERCSVQLNAI